GVEAGELLDEVAGLRLAGLAGVLRQRDHGLAPVLARGVPDEGLDFARCQLAADAVGDEVAAVGLLADADAGGIGGLLGVTGSKVPAARPAGTGRRSADKGEPGPLEHAALTRGGA